MALLVPSCSNYTSSNTFCLPITFEKEQDNFTVHEGWIAGAFFLGLFLGALLVAVLAKPCLTALDKKRQQDEEKLLDNKGKSDLIIVNKAHVWNEEKQIKSKGKKTFKVSRFWRKKTSSSLKDHETDEVNAEEIDPAMSRGMVEVMLQTSSSATEVEMADQDMAVIISMERSMEEEKNTLMLKTIASLLKKKEEKKRVSPNFVSNFTRKTEESMKDLTKMIEREKEEAEEKLRNDPKLSKDSQTLENEMQKIQSTYNNKQSKLQREYRNNIRQDLLKSSGMTEAEIDELIEKLMNNMSIVEEKIGIELARQKRALDQRLAKRRKDVEYMEEEDKQKEKLISSWVDTLKKIIFTFTNKEDNLGKEIISDYTKDLNAIKNDYDKELEKRKLVKYEELHKLRINSFYKLLKNQEREKAILFKGADKHRSIADFIMEFHNMLTKHHKEQEKLSLELDQNEVQELQNLKQALNTEEMKTMGKELEKIIPRLENLALLNKADPEKIIKLHKAKMSEYNAKMQREKQAVLARLQEKLQQRLNVADENEAQNEKEQEMLHEEQISALNKVLATNMDLNEEDKNKVLREHERNMKTLSNEMLFSRLRQQKSLEIKLNQRKVKLEELKKQQEQLKQDKSETDVKERKNLATKLEQEIAAEEEAFENARKSAVVELRKQLAKETEEALKVHDEELGLLIARLQIGDARRKAILEKQDQTLKKLQEEMERTIAAGEAPPSSLTDQIIQQHNNQVSLLNEQLNRKRKQQERMIQEKLSAKKQELEENIETQLEEEAQAEYTVKQKRGAGYASLALMQTFLEQKHAKAMQDLEEEMMTELEKYKLEINSSLEAELKKELEAQNKDFLLQLAKISKMPKRDLQDAFSATKSGEVDSLSAQRLAKDIRNTKNKSFDLDSKGGNKSQTKDVLPKLKSKPVVKNAFIDEEEDSDDF
ncbi:golgin subfamily A member 6-like protein 26 [Physella acuta]|uniref:golgin subfamily A member 6-like protein 26 n=1 Tax=Physella acuta TaxID=109671 RepID=UPI0027DB0DD8|nr:golgin subfamily A member 6-like protein 26 [Physella acuta]